MSIRTRDSSGHARWHRGLLPWLAGFVVALVLVKFSSSAVHDVMVWGLVAWALFRVKGRLLAPWMPGYAILFVIHAGVVLGSVFLAEHPGNAVRDMAKTATPLALALALPSLLNSPGRMRGMLTCFAVAVVAVAAVDGVRLVWTCGAGVWGSARFHEPYLLNHPNAASMLAGTALLILGIPLLTQTGSWRAGAWRIPSMGILGGYVLLMSSRGPQLALAATVVLCGVLLRGWRAKIVWFSVLALLGLYAVLNIGTLNPRFKEQKSMRNLSERTTVWNHTLKLSRAHWVLGYGYGKKTFTEVYYSSHPPASRFIYPHCHHYWLALFFHEGVVGVLLALLAWGALCLALMRALWGHSVLPADLRLVIGTTLALIALIHVYGLGDYPDSVVGHGLLWLPGIGVAALALVPKEKGDPS